MRPLDQLINNSGFFSYQLGKVCTLPVQMEMLYAAKLKLKYMKINPWLKDIQACIVFQVCYFVNMSNINNIIYIINMSDLWREVYQLL